MRIDGTTLIEVSNHDIDNTGTVQIPAWVTSIGWGAFRDCTDLTSLVIPASVTSIGNRAFYGCTGLIFLVIPDSVTSIGWEAFWDCTGLTELVIPDSVTSIGVYAFFGCTGLTELVIPAGVTIDPVAFAGCTGLQRIVVRSTDPAEIARIRRLLPFELLNNPNFEIIPLPSNVKSARKTVEVEVDQRPLNDFNLPLPEDKVDDKEVECRDKRLDREFISLTEDNVDDKEVECRDKRLDGELISLTEDNVDDKEVECRDKRLDRELISSIERKIRDEITRLQVGWNPFKSTADPKINALEKLIDLIKSPPEGVTTVKAIINQWQNDTLVTGNNDQKESISGVISKRRGFFSVNNATKTSQFITKLQDELGNQDLYPPDTQSLTKTV